MSSFQPLRCPHCGVSLNRYVGTTVCPSCKKDLETERIPPGTGTSGLSRGSQNLVAAALVGILAIIVLLQIPGIGLPIVLIALLVWLCIQGKRIDVLQHRQAELREKLFLLSEQHGRKGGLAPQTEVEPSVWHSPAEGYPAATVEFTPPATDEQASPAKPPLISTTPVLSGPADKVRPAWQPLSGASGGSSAAASLPSSEGRAPVLTLNWEQFMGVKLFSWIGGFVLFLAVAFFIKYSFEHNLVPPAARAALGFMLGAGLVVAGVLMKQREFTVTAQTFCATGIVILYAVTFACRSIYHFPLFTELSTFLVMAGITVTAFLLAVRLDALVVAILGLVGGFLTPALLATGEDNPVGLFSYIALLDAGLLAVAYRRRWHFLILMAAVGTELVQLGWVFRFFEPAKVFTALIVFLGFGLLFLAAFAYAEKRQQSNPWSAASVLGLGLMTLGFTFYLLGYKELGARPGIVFSFAFGADLVVLGAVFLNRSLRHAHGIAGMLLFLVLAAWTTIHLTPELLNWALALYLLLGLAHGLLPVLLQRAKPGTIEPRWSHLFLPLTLLLMLLPLLKQDTVSLVIWPAVFAVDALAVFLAILSASVLSLVGVLFLTVTLTAVWLLRIPADLAELPSLMIIIGGFAVFFFAATIWASKIIFAKLQDEPELGRSVSREMTLLFGKVPSRALDVQLPAMSAILPYLLLIMVTVRMPLADPSPVFGLALVLTVLTLGLVVVTGTEILALVNLACVFGLEAVWHQTHFSTEYPWIPLGWYLAFFAVHMLLPFVSRNRSDEQILPWAAAALSGPLHFFLVYRVMTLAFANSYMGLLPAAFAIPMLLAVAYVVREQPADSPGRMDRLAWLGGSALFFITLIFPIQFERQWLTIGWSLLGVALIWLYHRVPHPGLRATGVVLLVIAFARLALNPAVFSYYPRTGFPVLNWYLYTYGIVAICLMAGARLLAPPRHIVWTTNTPPVLYSLGTVLLFLLVNVQVADYFAEGDFLTFQFSGNFARDMSYSIAWALFALVLLMVGIWKRVLSARYAAIGLIAVTLAKLFFHDLNRLDQLHRIGAFLAVAVVLILASFLYQRFVSLEAKRGQS